jgi:hypothetical protein
MAEAMKKVPINIFTEEDKLKTVQLLSNNKKFSKSKLQDQMYLLARRCKYSNKRT